MHADELNRIRQEVSLVGAKIQPFLKPHAGLIRRNAYAHLWLGIRTRFGERWRESAIPAEIEAFLAWSGDNPNAEYEAFEGATTRVAFADAQWNARRAADEPTLFD
ncbi:MAG: hypothetical protein EXS17_03385 [Phycisphaerales bacterium]|nr:hypothetical protein [Phycisphaerales bacterium]